MPGKRIIAASADVARDTRAVCDLHQRHLSEFGAGRQHPPEAAADE